MGKLTSIFRALIKIAGKILFVAGIVLNICMVFFGFWPSLIYILIMLAGAGIVAASGDFNVKPDYQSLKNAASSFTAIVKKTDKREMTSTLTIAVITISCCLLLCICLLYVGQDYFRKRNTINDCKEITTALQSYRENKHIYPPDLFTLISNNPLRGGWDKDGWGNRYRYQMIKNGASFILASPGKDGVLNTGDDIVFEN